MVPSRQLHYIVAVAVAAAVLLFLATFNQQLFVAGVVALTVTLWVMERLSVPVVSAFAALLLVSGGSVSFAVVLQTLADPVLQLLLGSLLVARGLTVSGLAERVAYRVLRSTFATKSLPHLLGTLAAVSGGLSLFLSNTAVTAMLLPVGLTIIEKLRLRGRAEATGLLLMLSWGPSVAVGVLIASPPNLIAESALSRAGLLEIGFFKWSLFAMPVNIVMIIAAWIILSLLFVPRSNGVSGDASRALSSLPESEPVSAREKVSFAIFLVTVSLWILPDTLSLLIGRDALPFLKLLSPANVAVLGALLFLSIPARGSQGTKPVLSPVDVLKIDWRTMTLFAGGLVLGKATFDSGLAATLGRGILELSGAQSQLAITAIMVGLAIILSELTSNTAAASLLVPLSLALAHETGVSPIPPVLGTALGASFGFMMPISTPPNSIVYSSGQVSMKDMFRAGIVFDLVGFVVAVTGLWLVLPLLGWW